MQFRHHRNGADLCCHGFLTTIWTDPPTGRRLLLPADFPRHPTGFLSGLFTPGRVAQKADGFFAVRGFAVRLYSKGEYGSYDQFLLTKVSLMATMVFVRYGCLIS